MNETQLEAEDERDEHGHSYLQRVIIDEHQAHLHRLSMGERFPLLTRLIAAKNAITSQASVPGGNANFC